MRSQRKFIIFLYLFLASLVPVFIYIVAVDPASKVTVLGTSIGTPFFLFLLLLASFFLLFTFIFANIRRGLLTSIFLTGVFILRSFGFKSVFQTAIFLIIILLVEFMYSKQAPATKEDKHQ